MRRIFLLLAVEVIAPDRAVPCDREACRSPVAMTGPNCVRGTPAYPEAA